MENYKFRPMDTKDAQSASKHTADLISGGANVNPKTGALEVTHEQIKAAKLEMGGGHGAERETWKMFYVSGSSFVEATTEESASKKQRSFFRNYYTLPEHVEEFKTLMLDLRAQEYKLGDLKEMAYKQATKIVEVDVPEGDLVMKQLDKKYDENRIDPNILKEISETSLKIDQNIKRIKELSSDNTFEVYPLPPPPSGRKKR